MSADEAMLAAQARIFDALGHPLRLRLAGLLLGGELSVASLKALVSASPDLVTRQLGALHRAGVVRVRQRGGKHYCHLLMHCLPTFLGCTEEMVRQAAKGSRGGKQAPATPVV